jgi:hypothetical protein
VLLAGAIDDLVLADVELGGGLPQLLVERLVPCKLFPVVHRAVDERV